jgi:hypothetical protein
MRDGGVTTRTGPGSAPRGPARHEVPAIDDAALVVARHADRLLAAARSSGIVRWEKYLEPLPDRFRDGDLLDVRSAAMRARAAYGPKDSVRDALPAEVTEPFLEAVDRLLKVIARRDLRSEG